MGTFKDGWTFEIIETDDDYPKESFDSNNFHSNSIHTVPKPVDSAQNVNARSLEYKANLLLFQEKYEEAEALYVQAIKAYGVGNIDSVESLYNLAKTYENLARYDEAEHFYKQAYMISKGSQDKYPICKQALNSLAGIYSKQGRTDEAENVLMKAVYEDVDLSVYEDIQFVENCFNKLIDIYDKSCKYSKLAEFRNRLSNLKSKYFGYAL